MVTLEELVDFDLIEVGPVRLSVGAVNIRSGNFAYFDSADLRLQPLVLQRQARGPIAGRSRVVIDVGMVMLDDVGVRGRSHRVRREVLVHRMLHFV